MTNSGKSPKSPWAPEVRVIVTLLILILPTLIIGYILFAFGVSGLFGVQPTPDQELISSVFKPMLLISPFASIFGAIQFNMYIRKINRESLSRMSEAEHRSQSRRISQRYLLYTVIAGLALCIAAMNQAWPSVKDYYLTAKYQAEEQKALDKGCRSFYDIDKQENSDKEFDGHQMIVQQWDDEYYTETMIPMRADVAQSFEKCKEGLISPAEQQDLIDTYRLTVEQRAHELIEENPYNLSVVQMEKIRQLEQENHQ